VPSPIGHALGGAAAGWCLASERPRWPQTAVFAALGVLPDLDLLVDLHSTYSHSIGAAALVGLAAAFLPASLRARWSSLGRASFALACAAAYGSHIVLDWLGSDTTPPIGIMALWPVSSAFSQSDLHVFHAISRRYWLPSFWTMNLTAAVREIALLAPLVAFVGGVRALVARARTTAHVE
jgi:hypothetical protein